MGYEKRPRTGENKVKFMQAMDGKMLRTLEKEAKKRAVGIQELIRAVVVPEWLEHHRK
jgi:hypothetical protein